MASNEGLNVAIGANLSGLTTGLDRAVSSLERFASTLESIATSLVSAFNSLLPAVNNTTSTINNLSPVTATAAAGITNLSSAITSGQASFVGLGTASTQASTGINTITTSATNAVNSINSLSPASGASAAGITNLANAVQSGQASFAGLGRTTTQTSTGLNSITASTTNATYSINRLSPVTAASAAGITNLSRAITEGRVSLNGITLSASRLVPPLNNLNRPSGSAANSLQNLGRIASDAPFGFIAIQNNLDPLFESFRRLQAETGSTGGALRALGKSLMGTAGVALAFTAVSSLITVAIQKYGSLGNAIRALNPFISESARNQVILNKALLDGAQAGQGEVANLQLLYKASQDVNVPLNERKEIVDQLQKQFPDTFKNLSDEAILAGQAASAYESLTKALTAQAVVKATTDLAAEQLKKLVKLKIEADNLQAQLQEIRNPKGGRGIFDNTDPIRIDRDINSKLMEINKNKFEQVALDQKLADIQKIQLGLVEQYGAKVLGISKIEPPKAPKVKDIETDQEKITKILASIQSDFLRLDTVFAAVGGNAEDLALNRIPILTSALAQLSTLGAQPGTELFDSIKKQIDDLKAITTPTPVTIKIPIVIDPLPSAANNAAIAAITDGIKQKFRDGLIDVGKIVTDTLKSQLADGIASVSEGIGEAFSGGGLQSVLNGFVSTISSFGQSLGKQLIAQGVALIAFSTSLKSLNGYQSIIAGAALVAASAAFRSLAGNGISSYATGGVVTEPTLAMVGDNPGRKEAIVPSELWDKMGGGGAQSLSVDLDYDKLRIRLDQSERRARR